MRSIITTRSGLHEYAAAFRELADTFHMMELTLKASKNAGSSVVGVCVSIGVAR